MRRRIVSGAMVIIGITTILAGCGATKSCDQIHAFFYTNPDYTKLPDALQRASSHQATSTDQILVTSLAQQLHQIAQHDDTRLGAPAKHAAATLDGVFDGSFDQTEAAKVNQALQDLNNTYIDACSNISGQ